MDVGLDLQLASQHCRLLSDSTRLRLLLLLDREELSVAELSAITQLAQPRVSTHLAKLKEAGLVNDRRQGVSVYYRMAGRIEDPSLGAMWEVLRRNTGAVSLIVLLAYFFIALLDSMHFHPLQEDQPRDELVYSNRVMSVLDLFVGHLISQTEKTYAAPFATHLYTKETVESDQGIGDRIYPRLEHGGRHLQDPESDFVPDFIDRLIKVTGLTLVIWLGFWLAVYFVRSLFCTNENQFFLSVKKVVNRQTDYPWLAIILTTGVLCFIVLFFAEFSRYYHVFGTDKIGQDVLYQAIKSIRTGVLIGTLTTLVMLPFAIA